MAHYATLVALTSRGTPAREPEEFFLQPSKSQGEKMKRNQKGFSLIELLIVVAIILIIAAIAIPNLLKARIAANESSAVGTLRTVNTAQISFNSAYPTVGFAA